MSTLRSLLLYSCLVPLLAGTTTQSAAELPRAERVVARVNGVGIPAQRLADELDKITSRAELPASRIASVEQNIVQRLIERELIRQATEAASIVVDRADIDRGVAKYKARFQNDEAFEAYLQREGLTMSSIRQTVREQRALELLLVRRGVDLHVTRAEAKAFFAENEHAYSEQAGIRASHILVKLPETPTREDRAQAQEKLGRIQERLKRGVPFEQVALEMSEGLGAGKGGDLGFFSKGRMNKAFEDIAFEMEIGEVSAPVRTSSGYHIIKVTDRRTDRKKTFDEIEGQIVKSLENRKFFVARRALMVDLEKAAVIERFVARIPPSAPEVGVPDDEAEP